MGSTLTLYADGACDPNPGPASFGVVASVDGRVVCRMRKPIGVATNNAAEWRGALAALDYALASAERSVVLRMDSNLVVSQLTGLWRVKHPAMKRYAMVGEEILRKLRLAGVTVRIEWIPRELNHDADRVAARAQRQQKQRVSTASTVRAFYDRRTKGGGR